MALQDSQGNILKLKNDQFLPKLRKNRKLELRWGSEYYEAVNKAVFSNEHLPYMPAEPPTTIRAEVDKTGYVCKQCKDCFRFLSSIEEHTSRRSWVLGYWCQSCFVTQCTHPGKTMCRECRNLEASKSTYLIEKGMGKNLRKAVIRVFYNQCQFFAHLRVHGVVLVDLSELMLMPLPSEVEKHDYEQLDKLCRALMETMFIRRRHIMDWLDELSIPSNRWTTLLSWMYSTKKTPITDILTRYHDNCLNPMEFAERNRRSNVSQQQDPSRKPRKSVQTRPDKASVVDRSKEKKDDPPNDIAFVDCGPTPSHAAVSELPTVLLSDETNKSKTIAQLNTFYQRFSQQYNKAKEKPREILPKPIVENAQAPKTTTNRSAQRVVTIRSPRSMSISTIMKHLPSKNIVVVDSENGNGTPSVSPKVVVSVEPKKPEKIEDTANESTKKQQKIATPIIEPKNIGKTLLTKSQSFSEQMSLHGRIVFQNGRKYIIRHMPKTKSQSLLQDSVVKKIQSLPAIAPATAQPAKSILLPKTIVEVPRITRARSPEDSPKTPIDGRAKRAKFIGMKNSAPSARRNSMMYLKYRKERLTKMHKNLFMGCREALVKDLQRSTSSNIDKCIAHVKSINERYAKTMQFDADIVISNNEKAIKFFESIDISESNETPHEMSVIDHEFAKNTKLWEEHVQMENPNLCEICSKLVKPSSYLVGISKPASDETIYCQCYNTICYLCNANQGSSVQLKIHVRWHKGEIPYMCPNCTIIFKTPSDLELHLWTMCFHPMAHYVYGCNVCEIEGMLDMESVAEHFLLLHTRRRIICAECKMEYTGEAPSFNDYAKHYAINHPECTEITEPKRLLMCNLKQCIVLPEFFRTHLTDHIGVSKAVYYKCPFCTDCSLGTSRSKGLIREHLIDNHLDRMGEIVSLRNLDNIIDGMRSLLNEIATPNVINDDPSGPKILDARTITPATFEQVEDNNEETQLPRILDVRSEANDEFMADETGNEVDLELFTINSASDSPTTVQSDTFGLVTRAKSEESSLTHGKKKQIVVRRGRSLLTRQRLEIEDLSNLNDEIAVISMSGNESIELDKDCCVLEPYYDSQESEMSDYYPSPNLQSLLTSGDSIADKPRRIALNSPTDVQVEPIVYNCHLCGELVNTSWPVIKNHFDTRHSKDYEIFAVTPNIPRVTVDPVETNDYVDKKRKPEVITVSPQTAQKRRKRWGPKKHVDRPSSPSHGICVKPEPVQEIEGNFRCKKCEELFNDIEKLRAHIAKQHRIKAQYLICLECGENFVVVPSLQMHLKALHGIQDPIGYLAKNTAYAPEILDDTEEDEKATESNQCYVCMAVFVDKPSLDKHMRVHGMAFLRRKRFEAQKALKSSAKIVETGSNDVKGNEVIGDLNFIKIEDNAESGITNSDEKIVNDEIREESILDIDKIEPESVDL